VRKRRGVDLVPMTGVGRTRGQHQRGGNDEKDSETSEHHAGPQEAA
jgi:hypothetical protein